MRLIKGWGSNYTLLYVGYFFVHKEKCGSRKIILFKFDNSDEDIFWMIPISSQVPKYKREYVKSIKKYDKCDNISFGYVLGEERAFLPQNLFPATKEYIIGTYKDINTGLDIVIPKDLIAELNKKARKKIRYNQQGKKLGMTDIMKIYNELIKEDVTK